MCAFEVRVGESHSFSQIPKRIMKIQEPLLWKDKQNIHISSVQFSHSVVSNSATPWTAAHQAPCPSPTPAVYSNSCSSHRWGHPTSSSSVVPFSSRLQSFPASGSFPRNSQRKDFCRNFVLEGPKTEETNWIPTEPGRTFHNVLEAGRPAKYPC